MRPKFQSAMTRAINALILNLKRPQSGDEKPNTPIEPESMSKLDHNTMKVSNKCLAYH